MTVTYSDSLSHWIRQQIVNHVEQKVTFKQFMEWALYHPSLGYYVRSSEKLGKSGDFYTSPLVGAVFGETIGHYMHMLAQTFSNNRWSIVEFGGGDGKLAADIIRGLATTHSVRMLEAYHIVEASPDHRAKGKERLTHDDRVKWWSAFQRNEVFETPIIVIANEFIDALPVHRLQFSDGRWKEVYVTWNEQRACFEERLDSLSSEEVSRYVREESPPEVEGYTIEVNVHAEQWIRQLANVIDEGYVIVIDYGDDKQMLWHPHRIDGTLMCYYRHRAHDNPYIHVGDQDITAHVNFSSLERWGIRYGFSDVSMMTQAQFLIQAGILERLVSHANSDPFSSVAKHNRAIRHLISPEGMGHIFKVLLMRI